MSKIDELIDKIKKVDISNIKKPGDWIPSGVKKMIDFSIDSSKKIKECPDKYHYPEFIEGKQIPDEYLEITLNRELENLQYTNLIFPLFTNDKMKDFWYLFTKNNIPLGYIMELTNKKGILGEISFLDITENKRNVLKNALKSLDKFKEDFIKADNIFGDYDFNDYQENKNLNVDDVEDFYNKLDYIKSRLVSLLNEVKKDLNETDYKTIDYINSPISRKKNIENSEEIYFIKKLCIMNLKYFKEGLYKHILIMVELAFNSSYTYNELVKICHPIRNIFSEHSN